MRHPLHPALVHFPIACWSLATAADVVAWLGAPWPLETFAAALLVLGCGLGVLAVGAGFLELLKLPAAHPAERDVQWHMLLALGSGGLYAGSLFLRVEQYQLVPLTPLALLLSVLGFVVLLAAGWMGGRLVYRHGVGVTPQAEP